MDDERRRSGARQSGEGPSERGIETWRFGDPRSRLRELVEAGGVVAFPTESSYGLGVDPRNPRAVEAVYRIKSREAAKPLPVVVGHPRQLVHLGIDPNLPILLRLAACWPGPVTVILPRIDGAPPLPAVGERSSVAVRIPGHREMRELLEEIGPLTATSANVSGEPPVLEPEEAARLLAGSVEGPRGDGADLVTGTARGPRGVVIDGGVLPGGAPSTLLQPELDEGGEPVRLRLLREGRVAAKHLAKLLGVPLEPVEEGDEAP